MIITEGQAWDAYFVSTSFKEELAMQRKKYPNMTRNQAFDTCANSIYGKGINTIKGLRKRWDGMVIVDEDEFGPIDLSDESEGI